jgi:hypothetical protein
MKTKMNDKNWLRSLLAILVIGVSMLWTSNAMAQNQNFTGTWQLNESKSNLPEMGFRRPALKITATQDNVALNTERLSKGRDGEDRITKEAITLDGKECENVVFQDRKRKSVATWSADGKQLTIKSVMTFEFNGESREMKSMEVWQLSDDKSTLTINSTSDGRDGEIKSILVYEKAK